ncbi:head maturation protease, ClpP-related, partial [Peribacillus butanolivorans]|uniref:head maturation protease, ClpP-related n=1 Tax=Peribacillus butanolivorans TaxID=421767 RepID=UPI00365A271B
PNSSKKRDWYRFSNAAADEPAEILIYDYIGDYWYGVTAADFVRDLAALDSDEITVRINSPGGDVFDGIAILNALRGHKAKITTVVDGLAASAASFIAMAGDEVVMSRNSEMMIHDASNYCHGNAADMRTCAEDLERVSANIATVYAEKTGVDATEWRTAMQAETWYSAQEAVDAGLADRVDGADSTAKNAFDLSFFNFAGRRAAPAPTKPKNSSAAEAEANKKESHMATLQEALAERLGIDADADEATVLAAVDEALDERADNDSAGSGSEPTADQVTSYAQRNGLTVVDQAQYANLVASAQEGRDARAEQLRAADETFVTNAIAKGKFGPARRDHWMNALKLDREGATAAINSLADGLIPVAETGHSTEPAEDITNVRASDAYKGLEG